MFLEEWFDPEDENHNHNAAENWYWHNHNVSFHEEHSRTIANRHTNIALLGVLDLETGQQWRLIEQPNARFVQAEVVKMPPSWKPRNQRSRRRSRPRATSTPS